MRLNLQSSTELHSVDELVEAIYAVSPNIIYKALKQVILYLYKQDALREVSEADNDFIYKLSDIIISISSYNTELINLLINNNILEESENSHGSK